MTAQLSAKNLKGKGELMHKALKRPTQRPELESKIESTDAGLMNWQY